eukprot:2192260-Amphidinium_carterae.1
MTSHKPSQAMMKNSSWQGVSCRMGLPLPMHDLVQTRPQAKQHMSVTSRHERGISMRTKHGPTHFEHAVASALCLGAGVAPSACGHRTL